MAFLGRLWGVGFTVDLQTFLSLLVPPGTIVCAKKIDKIEPSGRPYSTFSHTVAKLHSDAAANIARMLADRKDIYFALASYKQGFHPHPKDPNKKQLRVRENVDSLKALWFDIDFKGEYPDLKTVAIALRAFSQATSLPSPNLMVGSGNGAHAYYVLEQPIPLDRWQKLADALKVAAVEVGFAHPDIKPTSVDLGCTIDACRVLRPPFTINWKDPANPKRVSVLHSSGQLYSADQIEAALTPWIGKSVRRSVIPPQAGGVYEELTGGLSRPHDITASFDTIIKHCGVARMIAETHGKDSVEPLWTASLQLLKHCTDGEVWVHPISDGHPGYNSGDTERKWGYRQTNSAGPTLCSTFEQYEPKICAKCPHRGFIKTPVQIGIEDATPMDGLPSGWRIMEGRKGVERLMIDPTTNNKEWVRVLRHLPMNLKATRSIVTKKYELSFEVEVNGSKTWAIDLPGAALGNGRKLNETLADYGFVLKEREAKSFGELMATWLGQLQAARRVADVTEQLGWLIEDEKTVGFSVGPSTFYSDGRVRNDVRAAREFASIAKYYDPRGGLEPWKRVAAFLTTQNNPAFTAVVAAAFATPLLKFTGLSGGILSIVSTASGVGKSSALKCSQAVWGSPTHGVNAVDDTPKSVARKLGFLNNLPAYWDELRGRKTVDDFLMLAFQITQGKEKTRLDSSAQLKEVQTWETMLVVASNESIFEAMARHGGGSDAGVVRTFEMVVEPFNIDRSRAEVALMFEALNGNYGHAGRLYAQWLASHAAEVELRVQTKFKNFAAIMKMRAAERFWIAIASILVVGAEIANELGLTQIDMRTLGRYLIDNVNRLRGRSVDAMNLSQPVEILATFMGAYQDKALVVDKFPAPKQNTKTYIPDLTGGIPKSDKIIYHMSRDENLLRIPKSEIERWLQYRELPVYNIMKRFRDEFGVRDVKVMLGVGTKWQLPPQRCIEIDLTKFNLTADEALKLAGPLSSGGTPDSHAPSVPANLTVDLSHP